jgi:group II intron reverse transcriptase/maturase
METALERIASIAKEQPDKRFTALVHHINQESLMACHYELAPGKAPGVDGQTRTEYGRDLEQNVEDLMARMKRQAYKPQPVRRAWIPKPGTDKKRPLGIPAYEDKLVQMALTKILNAIYEADFLDSSFGFRPNRGCHDALKILNHYIEKRNTNYIVDADIKGFFDHVDHQWLKKFLEHRIADPNLLRLITRFLKSGVMEAGIVQDTTQGTPQGGVVSPILANIYLHYVLDLWFEKEIRPKCRGQAYIVRYADDFVCCFEHRAEAEAFYRALRQRLAKFGLEIAEDKTKIISFGRHAKSNDKDDPETFDFLRFTHYCGQGQKGQFRVKRRTSRKKFTNSLMRAKEWIKQQRHLPIDELMERLRQKLRGYYQYYAITDNYYMVDRIREAIQKLVFKWLNRRSHSRSFNWEQYTRFIRNNPLPRPKTKVNIYELRPDIGYIM